jgi:predicted MFS family arabinose efflux permease
MSLGYSLAIAGLTGGVLAAPVALRLRPATLASLIGIVAAVGIGLAATATSPPLFLFGYGVVFGLANGAAYSLFLDRAADAMPSAKGRSAGIVTATYGLGAAAAAPLLGLALRQMPMPQVLGGLAAIMALVGVIAGCLFRQASGGDSIPGGQRHPVRAGHFVPWLWLVYFLGAASGLMIIAHAAGIAAAQDQPAAATLAPALVALGNIAGSLIGGWWAERGPASRALAAPNFVTVLALALLLAAPEFGLVALTICGGAYGALIAAVPVVVRRTAGDGGFAKAFGRVFTAWGLAGLVAPFAAGAIFDAFRGYAPAIVLGLTTALAAMFVAYLGRQFDRRNITAT